MRLRKAFKNISAASIELLKAQLSKMVQLGGCLSSTLPLAANPGKLVGSKLESIPESVTDPFMKQLISNNPLKAEKELKSRFVNTGRSTPCKKNMGSGISLTNNEIL